MKMGHKTNLVFKQTSFSTKKESALVLINEVKVFNLREMVADAPFQKLVDMNPECKLFFVEECAKFQQPEVEGDHLSEQFVSYTYYYYMLCPVKHINK